MLATKNIPEAIAYWKIFTEQYGHLNVACVFDNNIDNSDEGMAKEDAILEMLSAYNSKYGTNFGLSNYAKYKKDVAKRLAHKKPYTNIEHDHSQQIDLLIVVTQMLTGYDSKWVNTLHVDKLLSYDGVVQAFSRTNRIFDEHEKPWGNIIYYTMPHTMEQNIQDALELYVDQPLSVFVDRLEQNLKTINALFLHIRDIFANNQIENFATLPAPSSDRRMFAQNFCNMTRLIEAAQMQGFDWEKSTYEFSHGTSVNTVRMELDERTYQILLLRYRELFNGSGGGGSGDDREFDYPEDTYILEIGTGKIDAEYINSRFQRFIKQLYIDGPGSEQTKEALKELHKTFATLSQKDQRTAILILHDIQSGDLRPEAGKTIQDYVNEYQLKELYDQMNLLHDATGVDFDMLKGFMTSGVTEDNLDEFQRFSELRQTIDKQKTTAFIEMVFGTPVAPMFMMAKWSSLLKDFILDVEKRGKILYAYLHDGVTLDTAEIGETDVETGFEDLENSNQPTTIKVLPDNIIKQRIKDIISNTLSGVSRYMRPQNEIINVLFYVLDKESLETLDGVGIFVRRAFNNIFNEQLNIVDKFVAFNLLVTKFEAFLRKLYFLYAGEEVKPQHEGEDVTWANVIYSVKCLWNLKFNTDEAYQQLYQYLQMVKEWRNAESHISPTASEKEINSAIEIVLTMYCYATGSCITNLEVAGHDME